MNSKSLGIAITLLAVIMLATPVMATPKESSPAWYTLDATDTYYEVSYEDLTEMCLAAGLSENPYPAPTTPTIYTVNGVDHKDGASAYYIFSIEIGSTVYTGVACSVYDETFTWSTFTLRQLHKSTHYFGEFGDMNHGFKGTVTVFLQYTSMTAFYFIANWALEGFGHFTGQSLTLTQDSRTDEIASGTCLVLGNRYK